MCISRLFVVLLSLFASSQASSLLQCGRKNENSGLKTHIIKGVEADKNEFPWIASLYFVDDFFCGGSIITRNHILTAAHCIFDETETEPKLPGDIVAQLGRHRLDIEEKGSAKFYPTNIFIHENWDRHSLHNDIALLTSDSPIEFSRIIAPVCLWSRDLVSEQTDGTVVGWGISEKSHGGAETVLQKVSAQQFPTMQCLVDFPRSQRVVNEKTFCAKGVVANSGPCSGDSGEI